MINFRDTKVAFSTKSNFDLKKSYWLFKIIGWSWLTKISPVLLRLFMPLKFPIPLVKHTVFKHFCGGESKNDCDQNINKLAQFNVKTILDYSVEHQHEDTQQTFKEVFSVIAKAKNNSNIPFVVFKITGFINYDVLIKKNKNQPLNAKEKRHYDNSISKINDLCKKALETDVPIYIDAEESWIQNAIDAIVLQLMRTYNTQKVIVYNTIQLYRKNQLQTIEKLVELATAENFYLGLKLVRGAYVEKENERAKEFGYKSPIHNSKKECDRDFNLALDYCIKNIDRISICCGSHNEYSNQLLTKLMLNHKIESNDQRVYFAQLFGMSDHISFNLAKHGYNVAKYMPYGPVKDVLPYLIRRAQENTSIAGQTSRELSLITTELERRKVKGAL